MSALSAQLCIAPFRPADQDEVKRLIVAGLAEHWGGEDESLNHDLEDIARSYSSGIFLVAKIDDVVVATGALVPRAPSVGEIVRMSVAAGLRRRRIASQVLRALLAWAPTLGVSRVILETTATWRDVVAFYLANGFTITHDAEGPFGVDTWFALEIEPAGESRR